MPVTHLTAVMQRPDEGRLGLGHLLVVAPPEAESVPVTAGGAVEPAGRVLAGVREGLPGGGTQQLQEGQLDHVDGVPIGVAVGELRQRGGTQTAQLLSVMYGTAGTDRATLRPRCADGDGSNQRDGTRELNAADVGRMAMRARLSYEADKGRAIRLRPIVLL